MPELPEVEAIRGFLHAHCLGLVVDQTHIVSFACLKTATIPVTALRGAEVIDVTRRGKFLGLRVGETWLVTHLARAGWLRWYDQVPTTVPRPGKTPIALRLRFTDGSGFDLTEAGTRQRLAVYLVHDLADVPGVATLGPEPMAPQFTPEVFDHILNDAGRAQIKGVLRDQRILAGVGNAYSDEILWAAGLSPFAPAAGLDPTQRRRLYRALKDTLEQAVGRTHDVGVVGLKAEKKAGLAVHGRTGQPCPRCGGLIAEVSFADSSLQYCPTCQTKGKVLADRRLSRLLK
ncbi:MAG: Fpg/Nei family DNA glycosylase [Propionibacteriaceae bacterium]|nr:Fpg/Nei family DNA glycosylase [Propionibacteriaceae bacterium]